MPCPYTLEYNVVPHLNGNRYKCICVLRKQDRKPLDVIRVAGVDFSQVCEENKTALSFFLTNLRMRSPVFTKP